LAIEKLHITQFLSLANLHPVLDVRSPGEYTHAHIPGAHSFPLFTDEERKIVGTTYKQQSREAAIKIGLDFFGPKMRKMLEEVENLIKYHNKSKIVLVHCWRGGMRSAGVAWLLDLYGFKVYTLVGGYKFFRRWTLQEFEKPRAFNILGGYTGSGKTELLKQLTSSGERIIDLESLANHKGSAFGNIGLPAQPSQEMFENLLAWGLHFGVLQENGTGEESISDNRQSQKSLWLEDESQRIGSVNIPQAIWQQMRSADVYFLDVPFNERLRHIAEEYGQLDRTKMIDAIERIRKRLGGMEAKTATSLLQENKIEDAFRILLKYYDKWYLKGLMNRKELSGQCISIKLERVDAEENAKQFLEYVHTLQNKKKLIDEPGYR
jgi:tRNA 2-selenouridine synthase